MRTGVVFAAVLFIGGSALAEDAPKPTVPAAPGVKPALPPTLEQATEAALSAVKAKDDAALDALARRTDPDPWLVADALLAREDGAAAAAFSSRAPGGNAKRLPAYVASQRQRPDDKSSRELLEESAHEAPPTALALLDKAKPRGDDVLSVALLEARARALKSWGRWDDGARACAQAVLAAEHLGWPAAAAVNRMCVASGQFMSGDNQAALETCERLRIGDDSLGGGALEGRAFALQGHVFLSVGRKERAAPALERAIDLLAAWFEWTGPGSVEDAEAHIALSSALSDLVEVKSALGLHQDVLSSAGRAIEINRRFGLSRVARIRQHEGRARLLLGDTLGAWTSLEEALDLFRSQGNPDRAVQTLSMLGMLHALVGNYARAREMLEQARKFHDEQNDLAGVAADLLATASVYWAEEEYPAALDALKEPLRIFQSLGAKKWLALALAFVAELHLKLGDASQALAVSTRAVEAYERLGESGGALARALSIRGVSHALLGHVQPALEDCSRALSMVDEARNRSHLGPILESVARVQLLAGRSRDAIASARRALPEFWAFSLRLADGEGAYLRRLGAGIYEIGARAGAALASADEIAYFLESGRAGGLLESLKSRELLREAVVPPELLRTESEARGKEALAVAKYREALDGDDRARIKVLLNEMEAAQEAVREVGARIQRDARAAAGVLYPAADDLDLIRGRLAADEALVSYGLFDEEPLALVVTSTGAEFARLPATKDVEAACQRLLAEIDEPTGPETASKAAGALRDLVVTPLGLALKTKRLLISPDGALSYVPFALLAPDREIVYVPSGTTCGLLLEDGKARGDAVLALGDPDYQSKVDERAVGIYHRGGASRLARLPATADEARAVGETVLLGKDATEKRLRDAVATKPRWRAVHLACHGLIDAERPAFSSLALTADGQDDGFLTTLEVFRSRIPADLVVLSACETAKGKIVRGEGIMGLTRAFMFAGAPRVICSLWKVDDDATRALMVKFYELWNPKDGKPGLPTATALKQAQEFVRSHEKWKHPHYWAAWVLWGLPD